mgnify:CR=1 FL=1
MMWTARNWLALGAMSLLLVGPDARGQNPVARAHFETARDHLCAALNTLPGVHAPPPPGAMYAFFRVDGLTDSLGFCKRLVSDNGVGLAPGAAFGDEGEGFVRWCFASDPARLDRAIERFARGLADFRSQK